MPSSQGLFALHQNPHSTTNAFSRRFVSVGLLRVRMPRSIIPGRQTHAISSRIQGDLRVTLAGLENPAGHRMKQGTRMPFS